MKRKSTVIKEKINYEFEVDEKGQKIAYRVDVATNKRTQIDYKLAQKRHRDLAYRRKRSDVEYYLKREGGGGTYNEYQIGFEKEITKIKRWRRKEGKEPLSESRLRAQAKRNTIKYRTGTYCRYRYGFLFYRTIEEDHIGNQICDTTPEFRSMHDKSNSGENYLTYIDICKDAYALIKTIYCKKLKIEGGACVMHIRRSDNHVIKAWGIPDSSAGCSMAFDWTQRA